MSVKQYWGVVLNIAQFSLYKYMSVHMANVLSWKAQVEIVLEDQVAGRSK